MKKKSFTLVEMVLALVVFGMVFVTLMSIYTRMINVKREFDARNYLLTTSYTILEKLNILLKDYTIDYEEYFNRRMAGCTTHDAMTGWVVGTGGYCDTFDGYGNSSPISTLNSWGAALTDPDWHVLYHCSSSITSPYIDDSTFSYVADEPSVLTGAGCVASGEVQSFGEYAYQFIDVKDNADETPSPVGDDDDTDVGKGPVSIIDDQNVAELYLISKDKKSRLLLRRKLAQENDLNGDGIIQPFERLYVIQMLQLRGFDAGTKHNFDAGDADNQYMYDGQTDTWACDYEKGFICHGTGVNTSIYSGYNIASGADDGWVNLFGSDITVSNWNLQIYPIKDPVYAWSEGDMQINPYIKILLTTYLYSPARYTKMSSNAFDKIFYTLQTTFNIKTNY